MEKALSLVKHHIARYPESGIEDVYKLLYHACMGPEHAASDPAGVKHWLEKEWEEVTALEGDVYEDIAVHSPIFRIHLGPAKYAGHTTGDILGAFLRTAEMFPKRPDLLSEVWQAVVKEIEEGRLKVADSEELAEFDKLVRENDFPAVQHSENYRNAHKPAYRLVHSKL